ncbi:unnamed protein product [Prunus armeniaca]|uniref:Uncharacterized protein n=1 Tax=Prunus armeniaca TaxID=36596 RepID=A0A6J5WIF3_PRUAR|nr:unnamed protein product [Prunus armeniaca]
MGGMGEIDARGDWFCNIFLAGMDARTGKMLQKGWSIKNLAVVTFLSRRQWCLFGLSLASELALSLPYCKQKIKVNKKGLAPLTRPKWEKTYG